MNTDLLVLPEGLAQFALTKRILSGHWGSAFHKSVRDDLRHIGFVLTQPCLCYLVSGRETLSADGMDDFLLNPGEMALIPPGGEMFSDFRHRDGPLEAYLYFFSGEIVKEFCAAQAGDVAMAPPGILHFPTAPEMTAFMRSTDIIYGTSRAPGTLVRLKLLELLHLLGRARGGGAVASALQGAGGGATRPRIRDVMRASYGHQLSVADYARLSGRSIASFNRDFKRVFGMPPGKWLARRRLSQARRLLIETEASVTDVSLQIGYRNTSHFIARFRSEFGQTPHQLRKQAGPPNGHLQI